MTTPGCHKVRLRRGPLSDEVSPRHRYLCLCPQAEPSRFETLTRPKPEDIAISVITEVELRAGRAKNTQGRKLCTFSKISSSPWHCRIQIERRGFVCSSAREARAGRNTDWSTGQNEPVTKRIALYIMHPHNWKSGTVKGL